MGIAVSGTGVFVIGDFTSTGPVSIAGQDLTGAGAIDVFVAKYVDTSTGSTPATSRFVNGWATSGGGTGDDRGQGIAVSGTGVFVTGSFSSGHNTFLAGQTLTGAANGDVFVAKYLDKSTETVPVTSTFVNSWAISAGGKGDDQGNGIAVKGVNVFVAGYFTSGTAASIAGQDLPGAGGYDVFAANYLDAGTSSMPVTTSVANVWATSAGGAGDDFGNGIAVSGQQVYVVGKAVPTAVFGSLTIDTPALSTTGFVARLTKAAPAPLPVHMAAPGSANFALSPNPAGTSRSVTLTGATPFTTGQVLDALGRRVATFPTDATGRATLPAGLAPGLYVVHVGTVTGRWVVE
jgi:hypothetical protein